MIRVVANFGRTRRAMARFGRNTRKWAAQELNRQNRAFKGGTGRSRALPVQGIVRRIALDTQIRPLKRIARRVVLPRGGWATARHLVAGGLTLFESLPMRYFKSGVPSSARRVPNVEDKHGRRYVGQPFYATMKSGASGQFRRLEPKRWVGRRPDPNNPNDLPIDWSDYVDVSLLMRKHRAAVLRRLGALWPRQIRMRFDREWRRIFA